MMYKKYKNISLLLGDDFFMNKSILVILFVLAFYLLVGNISANKIYS
jgi:hypothetical protein